MATYQSFHLRNVYVYERSAQGTWSSPTLVLSASGPSHPHPQVRIAIQGNILAMVFRDQLYVAERSASGWSQTSSLLKPHGIGSMGGDVDIDAGTIVVSGESGRAQALIFRKNSSGHWNYFENVNGEAFAPGEYEHFFGGDSTDLPQRRSAKSQRSTHRRSDRHNQSAAHRHGGDRLVRSDGAVHR